MFEAQLDKEFFQENLNKGKKVKLTKAEKRALKFMARREGGVGAEIVFDDIGSQNIPAVKSMLTNDKKFKKGGKNRVGADDLLDGYGRKWDQ